MKAAVSFSGFKLCTILQQDFHVEGHRPQQEGPGTPRPPVTTRLAVSHLNCFTLSLKFT